MSEARVEQGLPDEASGGVSVGETLRRARAARGETVGDVAYALKLTPRQIDAMESDRFDLLPGRAFARGFLRNYARYVGLDAAALLARFDSAASGPAVELAPLSNANAVMPTGARARATRVPAALVVGGLLALVAVGWFFDWFRMPAPDAGGVDAPVTAPELSPVPDAADVLAPGEEAPPSVPSIAVPTAPDVPLQFPPAGADAPQSVPAPLVAPPEESARTGIDAPGIVAPESSASGPPASGTAPLPTTPTEVAPAAPANALVFRFSGESWVEVRDSAGTVVYSGLNAPGTTRTVQGRPPYSLVIGNGRDVALEYQGKTFDLAPHIRGSVARLTVK